MRSPKFQRHNHTQKALNFKLRTKSQLTSKIKHVVLTSKGDQILNIFYETKTWLEFWKSRTSNLRKLARKRDIHRQEKSNGKKMNLLGIRRVAVIVRLVFGFRP